MTEQDQAEGRDMRSLIKRLHDAADHIDEVADALDDHFTRDEGDHQCGNPGCACAGRHGTPAGQSA